MSSVTVKTLDVGAHVGGDILHLPFKLLGACAAAIVGACEGAAGAFSVAIAEHAPGQSKRSGAWDACCDIPERSCPPRCVCEIKWEAADGDDLRALVRVRNVSQVSRTFAFESTELVGWAATLGTMSISPAQLTLDPGMSDVIEATLTIPGGVEKGEYEGEILVRGAYEQCVRTVAKVVKKKWAHGRRTAACEVEQGAPPVRIRAHNWYDHFQCTEPCAAGAAPHM